MIFFIGFPKTASTYLHEVFKLQNSLDVAISKDHNFFSINKNAFSEQKYNSLFKNNKKLKIDFDHSLIYDIKGIKKIISIYPDAKFILVTRHTKELAISNFLYQVSQGKYSNNQNQLIKFLNEQKDEFIQYPHIKSIMDIIDSKNFLLLSFQDLQENVEEFFKEISKFIDVQDIKYKNIKKINEKRASRYPKFIAFFLREINLVIRKISPKIHYYLKRNKLINKILFKKTNVKFKLEFPANIKNDIEKDISNINNLLLDKSK